MPGRQKTTWQMNSEASTTHAPKFGKTHMDFAKSNFTFSAINQKRNYYFVAVIRNI